MTELTTVRHNTIEPTTTTGILVETNGRTKHALLVNDCRRYVTGRIIRGPETPAPAPAQAVPRNEAHARNDAMRSGSNICPVVGDNVYECECAGCRAWRRGVA